MATPDALLALLAGGPRHGYDLKRAHDAWYAGLRPLAFGQVYATLARLERDGLVGVAHTESGGGPERVVYELTPQGRERLDAWLAEPAEPGVAGADELIRKTLAAYHLQSDVDGVVARQRATHLRRLRSLQEATGSDGEIGSSMATDHTLLHLDADLRWLDLAAERMRSGPPGAPPNGRPGAAGNHRDSESDTRSQEARS